MAPLSFHLDDDDDADASAAGISIQQESNNTSSSSSIKMMIPLGFTSGVIGAIRTSRINMNKWVEREKRKVDAEAESYHQRLSECQATIDRKSTELKMIQKQRGLISNDDGDKNEDGEGENLAARKQALEEQATQLEVEIMKLQTQRDNRLERLKTIGLEESRHRLRAEEARSLKKRADEARLITVDDLTKGIVNYKRLGLDFETTKGENEIRWSFSQLDPKDPERKCSFVLIVDDQDKYAILDCQPALDSAEIAEILEEVNDSESITLLARRMRSAFKRLCTELS